MTEFARGGVIVGFDPTPIYTETMFVLSRWDGYVLPASAVRECAAAKQALATLRMLTLNPVPVPPSQ